MTEQRRDADRAPVHEADWFRRFPTGGTVRQRPMGEPVSPVDHFRHMPNGGATVYVQDSGNPYASLEDEVVRPVVDVQLPAFEEES